MLLDPLEEKLDLPAAFVKRADRCCRQDHLVGEEDERFSGLGILESNTPQLGRIVAPGVIAIQGNRLVAENTGTAVGWRRIDAMGIQVRFGTGHEESPRLMQPVQAGEINLTAIHDVNRTGFRGQQVQRMDIVQFPVGDVDKTGNTAASHRDFLWSQVEQRMHLHRRLGGTEINPRGLASCHGAVL